MENANVSNRMHEIYEHCNSQLKEFEIWPAYYKVRYDEFAKFYTLFPEKHFKNTLEIACGIGYQASFLSCMSDKVTASDVDLGDMIQHSRGLDVARRFIKQLGVQNVEIVNADAGNLPFGDEQFDFIYCSYSLQCMPDMAKALREISRVLKKDGYFFCTIPTTVFTARVAGNYYKEIFKKLTGSAGSSPGKDAIAAKGTVNNTNSIKRKWYAKLLPPSEHKNFFNELFVYSTGNWLRLFKKNGHRVIVKKYSTFKAGDNSGGSLKNAREKLSSAGIILITKKIA